MSCLLEVWKECGQWVTGVGQLGRSGGQRAMTHTRVTFTPHPVPTLVQCLAQKSCTFYPGLVFRANDVPRRLQPRTPSSLKHGGESKPPSLCSLGPPCPTAATGHNWQPLPLGSSEGPPPPHCSPATQIPLHGWICCTSYRQDYKQTARSLPPQGLCCGEPPCPR